MSGNNQNVLITRANDTMYEAVIGVCPNAVYNQLGRTTVIMNKPIEMSEHKIAIVAVGSSDLPVVEEAYDTGRMMGNRVVNIDNGFGAAYNASMINQLK